MKSASLDPCSTALRLKGRHGGLPLRGFHAGLTQAGFHAGLLLPGFDDDLEESHPTTRSADLRRDAGLFVRRHGDLYPVRRRDSRRARRRARVVENIAGDRPVSDVVLSLRPVRFSPDPTPRRTVAAALAGAGDRMYVSRVVVLHLPADPAGAERYSAQHVVDADIYGRVAIPGPMAARPPAIGPSRADSGRRAGRGHDRARDAHSPRSRIRRDRIYR